MCFFKYIEIARIYRVIERKYSKETVSQTLGKHFMSYSPKKLPLSTFYSKTQ